MATPTFTLAHMWEEEPMDLSYFCRELRDEAPSDFLAPYCVNDEIHQDTCAFDGDCSKAYQARPPVSTPVDQELPLEHQGRGNKRPGVDIDLLMAAIIKHLESEEFEGDIDTLVRNEYQFFKVKLAQLSMPVYSIEGDHRE